MNSRTAGATAFALLSLACLPAAAQSPTQAPSAQDLESSPPLRLTTRMVQVSVVVQDKKGEPILGLTKDDFTVLDEKQPQSIQLFSVHTNAMPAQPPPPLPADTYTNRLAERAEVPKSVTVILLDALNTDFSDQESARRQIIRFLSELQPQDRVGIYTLDYQLNVLHDFTTDSSALIASLKKYKGERLPDEARSVPRTVDTPPERGANSNDALVAFLNLQIDRESNFYAAKRVRVTSDALESIARHLGSLPGRKNLVWVSGSFPITAGFGDASKLTPTQSHDKADFVENVERAARALNDANVAVYPVDARGLLPMNGNPQRALGPEAASLNGPAMTHSEGPEYLSTMSFLADRTGGRMFYDDNDLMAAVRMAVADSRVTYELGYYPAGVKWDGKFHSIHVKVNRRGVRVRARNGYVARPDRAVTKEEQDAFVAAAAYSPIEATEIKMIVQVHAANISGTPQMNVFLHFDPHDISFRQVDADWEANAEVVYAQTDETGKILEAPNATMALKFTTARYQQLLRSGISYSRDVPINRRATELRVILHDEANGTIGSVIVPLKSYFPPPEP